MGVLEEALSNDGFFIDYVIPDGTLRRFKRDDNDKGKSAWVVAHKISLSENSDPFFLMVYGDWHEPDNVYKFCSNKNQSPEEKRNVDSIIRKTKKIQLKEQEKVWIETSIKSQEIWNELSETESTPYLEKKKIGLCGARSKDEILHVPVRDIEGKLWGLQKIYPDGKKMFMPGTKKKGNFHIIRGPNPITESDKIYICEGFATGGSIYEATKETVVVAFDSGNLELVSKSIRQVCTSADIVICGDDDLYTKKPDGTKYNPGREAAESAANSSFSRCIFPAFKDDDFKSTDFNDMHCTIGIDSVRDVLKKEKNIPPKIFPLGHRGLTYFYSSTTNEQILPVTSHSPENLISLQPLEYWDAVYPGKRGVNWLKAASSLKQQCIKRGIFNPQNVRGLGVWLDEGRTVVHLGNRLLVDDQIMGLHEIKTKYIYSLEETHASIEGSPLENCNHLVTACYNMAWSRPQDSKFFMGWLVAASLSGILKWRPHMWLIGGTGAGKSVTYEIIAKIMGGHVTTLAGGTSEAGLRRAVKGSSLPLIFDEFELNDQSTMQENQRILAFMRQASSDSSAQIVKADVGTNGIVTYQPRFCAFVAGIRPSFTNEADRNRFTLIQLDKTRQNANQWNLVKDSLKQITPQYATNFFLRSLKLISVYKNNIEVYSDILSKVHYARFSQQFAPILAGYHCILSDVEASKAEAEAIVNDMQLENEVSEIREQNDEQEAINLLLHTKVRCGVAGDRAIIELVNGAMGSDEEANHLQRYGLKVLKKENRLFISGIHPELSKIFDKTKFLVNWKYSISRLPGADKSSTCRILGKVSRGVTIPLEYIASGAE